MSQLDLFGAPQGDSPASRSRATPPAAAALQSDVPALAARLPPALRLGTCSWAFPGWSGLVYDAQYPEPRLAREGLAAYAAHPLLRTVSVDRSYYAPIPEAAWAAYAAQVPADFRFVVKMPALATSMLDPSAPRGSARPNPRFLDAAFAADALVGPALAGLGTKLGPILLQFPPMPRGGALAVPAFAERLAAFVAALPRGPLYAVEVRDAALLGAPYAAALAEARAVHCVSVHPRMPSVEAQARLLREGAPMVVRWNLHGGLAYEAAKSRYAPFDRLVDEDPGTREALAAMLLRGLATGAEAWVTANNKAEGSAPLTLLRLAEAIAAAS